MKASLSTKWFGWLALSVAIFCLAQLGIMLGFESLELLHGTASSDVAREEYAEIALLASISAGVFILMLGGFFFISRRMMQPIRAIAVSAKRISDGDLHERVAGEGSSYEVSLLATALNRAFDRYNMALYRTDSFAGNAAHQLRTPLSSIRSIGEIALQERRTPDEYRHCIEDILEVTHDLTSIVEKLLMLARLNRSSIQQSFGVIDIQDILAESVDLHQASLEEKGVELKVDLCSEARAKGDASLLKQAILNIIDNAIQFAPHGSVIEISLERDEDEYVLCVSDAGPGMPEALCQYFNRPCNDYTLGQQTPTSGLGLTLAREILHLHKGAMDVTSRDNEGTCVRLRIPAGA